MMMSFKKHLIISILIRLFLIYYGEIQDTISDVQYTDVDYRVVTDGASYVLNNKSPFQRHTYRYTPILSYLVIFNLMIHKSYGKILFSLFDIAVGILIKYIIVDEFESSKTFVETKLMNLEKLNRGKVNSKRRNELKQKSNLPNKFIRIAEISSYFWLYNPLTMVIATRGNGDSITCALVLASLYYLLRPTASEMSGETIKDRQYLISGIFLGLAVHFRLYPIAFSLSYFLTLCDRKIGTFSDFLIAVVKPNNKQVMLITGTIATLAFATGLFYLLYGYQFLYESVIYHLVRKDIRHNFSLYFYLQYLSSNFDITILEKILTFLPQFILLIVLSWYFGRNRQTLPFCIFSISFIMVTYNPVVTSQYFVWFLSILPLCIKNLRKLSYKKIFLLPIMWFLSQGGWLLPAYLLEFMGWNTFEFIWLQSVVFFTSNILILHMLVSNYDVIYNYKAQ